MTDHTELEAILAPLRSSFHARRRDTIAQCEAISHLLDSYTNAVDNAILRELAKSHGLPSPPPTLDAKRLALDLLSKVQNLPELQQLPPRTEQLPKEPPQPARSVPTAPAKTNVALPAVGSNTWPLVRQALQEHPLVIVGGPPHLERLTSFGVDTKQQVEWVDTTRQGTHAIGNLERRIKDKRISALVILEGLVQHRHSDPLISTARGAKVAHAFGGKGGRTALAQALDELERTLQQQR